VACWLRWQHVGNGNGGKVESTATLGYMLADNIKKNPHLPKTES